MTPEDKELLLKDLSARVPFGVKAWYKYFPPINNITSKFVTSIRLADNEVALSHNFNKEGYCEPIEEGGEIIIKPYLRPMSSMTEEEQKEFDEFCVIDEDAWMDKGISGYVNQAEIMSKGVDWLNSHHFDY